MNIDFGKINEIYGEDGLETCRENVDYLVDNINYLIRLGFDYYEEIIERYPLAFVEEPSIVKKKLDNLIKRLGGEYLEILSDDMSLFEELL